VRTYTTRLSASTTRGAAGLPRRDDVVGLTRELHKDLEALDVEVAVRRAARDGVEGGDGRPLSIAAQANRRAALEERGHPLPHLVQHVDDLGRLADAKREKLKRSAHVDHAEVGFHDEGRRRRLPRRDDALRSAAPPMGRSVRCAKCGTDEACAALRHLVGAPPRRRRGDCGRRLGESRRPRGCCDPDARSGGEARLRPRNAKVSSRRRRATFLKGTPPGALWGGLRPPGFTRVAAQSSQVAADVRVAASASL